MGNAVVCSIPLRYDLFFLYTLKRDSHISMFVLLTFPLGSDILCVEVSADPISDVASRLVALMGCGASFLFSFPYDWL